MAASIAQTLGHRDSAAGDRAPAGALYDTPAAVASRSAGLAGVGSQGVPCSVVCLDVDSAVVGLGHDFSGGRPGDAQQLPAIAFHRTGGCPDLRTVAQGTWLHGLSIVPDRSEAHTSEVQSLMRTSSAVFCLKNNTTNLYSHHNLQTTH